jgi:3-hydroxyacyl-[acyl-carrier-protein] dehydratase
MPDKQGSIFEVSNTEHQNSGIKAVLIINKHCYIFKGHFPGWPVVPGACMLQILKEVLEDTLNTTLRLKKADHLKFIEMINPENTQSVDLDISYKFSQEGEIILTAELKAKGAVCFKFQGSFIKA